MDILLVERDHLIRDQVKVGLQQFSEFHVTVGEGYAALNELRQRQYDAVFIGVDGRGPDGIKLLQHLRGIDKTIELIVITSDRQARDMQRDKARFKIGAFLQTPVRATDFFRLIARLRERHAMDETAAPVGAGHAGRRR